MFKLAQSKTFALPEVGDVLFRKNIRARRLTISISRRGTVVTIPGFLSYAEAQRFVLSKKDWIISKLNAAPKAIVFSNSTPYSTRKSSLNLVPEVRTNIFVKVEKGFINVRYPSNIEESDELVQNAARKGIDLAFRLEAHAYLPMRTKELAQEKGLTFQKLSIRRTLTRWGSCSAANNLNLSIYLMKLPNELIDYVILHELAHTKVKNHSAQFWSYLDTLTGQKSKLLAKQLKGFRTGV